MIQSIEETTRNIAITLLRDEEVVTSAKIDEAMRKIQVLFPGFDTKELSENMMLHFRQAAMFSE